MTTTRKIAPGADVRLVAALAAWNELFGPQAISWPEVEAFGVGLQQAEAERHLNGARLPATRGQLYELLFKRFPELREFFRLKKMLGAPQNLAPADHARPAGTPKRRKGPPHHFIALLSAQVAPPPATELTHLLERARRSSDASAWLPTRAPGLKWRPAEPGEAIAVVFWRPPAGGVDLIVAEVRERRDRRPPDPSLDHLYARNRDFKAWWRLAHPERFSLASLDDVPGESRNRNVAATTFSGRTSFAYWDFGMPRTALTELLNRRAR